MSPYRKYDNVNPKWNRSTTSGIDRGLRSSTVPFKGTLLNNETTLKLTIISMGATLRFFKIHIFQFVTWCSQFPTKCDNSPNKYLPRSYVGVSKILTISGSGVPMLCIFGSSYIFGGLDGCGFTDRPGSLIPNLAFYPSTGICRDLPVCDIQQQFSIFAHRCKLWLYLYLPAESPRWDCPLN